MNVLWERIIDDKQIIDEYRNHSSSDRWSIGNGNGSSLIMVQGSGGVPMGLAIPWMCWRIQSEAKQVFDPPVTFRQLLSHQIMLLAQIGHDLILCLLFFFFQQVVTNRDTQETLLCMACVFEVSNSEHGAQHHIYRLVKDWTWLFI